jgi:hypothetical protein
MTAKQSINKSTGYNSTYPKGGVSYSKDSFVVNGTLVFQIKFCGKRPALRVAAKCSGEIPLGFRLNVRATSSPAQQSPAGLH